jgi:hypothetical protein
MLGGDLGSLSGEAEGGVGDLQIEMLFHFVGVEHLTHLEGDFRGTTQRISLALDSSLDAGQILFRRRQQIFALAGAFSGKLGVAADDEPLAGEAGGCDARRACPCEGGGHAGRTASVARRRYSPIP